MLLVNGSFKVKFLVACEVKRDVHIDYGEIVRLTTCIRHGARVSCSESVCYLRSRKAINLSLLLSEEHQIATIILSLYLSKVFSHRLNKLSGVSGRIEIRLHTAQAYLIVFYRTNPSLLLETNPTGNHED